MTIALTQVVQHNPVRALLRTNWRSYRVPAIALILIGLAVYVLGIIVFLNRDPSYKHYNSLCYAIADTSTQAIAISTLIAAALGGMSIAGERADRTALFVAMLPVSRIQIAMSKLAVSAFLMISAVLVHLIVGGGALLIQFAALRKASVPWQKPVQLHDVIGSQVEPLLVYIAVAFSMFCIAWLLGSFSKSAVISACTGIAVTVAGFILLASYMALYTASLWLSVVFSLPSLIVGTVIYCRRTEP